MANYAYKPAASERIALARMEGINASYKDLVNVCANIRGRNAQKALDFLKAAAEGKRPIRLYKYNKHRSHVGRLGGAKGGWPIKSCKIVLKVLENAISNAQSKGMGQCKIVHIIANKQHSYGRLAPKGRRIRQDLETAFVEIALKEIEAKEAKEKDSKEAKEEKKQAKEQSQEKKS
jgi:large subunit ribosomal protein L17e